MRVLDGPQIALHEVGFGSHCEQIQWARVYETASVPSESVEGDDYIVPDACFAGQPTVSFKPGEIGRGCRSHRQTSTMVIALWVDLWKSSAPEASVSPSLVPAFLREHQRGC